MQAKQPEELPGNEIDELMLISQHCRDANQNKPDFDRGPHDSARIRNVHHPKQRPQRDV